MVLYILLKFIKNNMYLLECIYFFVVHISKSFRNSELSDYRLFRFKILCPIHFCIILLQTCVEHISNEKITKQNVRKEKKK